MLLTVDADERSPERLREWTARLEAGGILFFPRSPITFPDDDLRFLLAQEQVGAGYHKNIAYRPARSPNRAGRVTGSVKSSPDSEERLRRIMRAYSQNVLAFLSRFLSPYQQRWHVDYASYRPQAEEARQLALRKRNDLLHTDAFPTRPTRGDRIFRFFNNINPKPDGTRHWVTGGTFRELASRYTAHAPAPEGKIALPTPVSSLGKIKQAIGALTPIHAIAPSLARSPYDAFMMDFHNFLKENADYQRDCEKQHIRFPPGSSWMVYTDTVSHAVLAGQFALEQTLLVRHEAMVAPESSPLRTLERMAGGKLV